jgi:phage terminase large subunit
MTAQAKVQRVRVPLPPKYGTVWESAKPYQIWYGGRGSAKSWTKAIYFLWKSIEKQYNRTIFARDTQKNVRLSQYQLFKDIAGRFPCFQNKFDFADTTMKITCRENGNFLVGGSFEQPDTLRSVADPTDFWAEEPITRESQINRQDFFDITGSLRNSHGIQTQFHFTFNPISKETWIYKDFFEADIFDCEKLFVNYPDNPFCPKDLIKFLESLKELDPKRYLVDALGEWGIAFEGLIYKEYEAVSDMPEAEYYGLDFGYNDPCALVEIAIADTPNQLKKDLFWNELLYEREHTAESLVARFDQLGINKRLLMRCDNARPEMIKALTNAGYRAEPCEKYKGSVADGIARVKEYNLKIKRGSKNLFDEIANYVWADKEGELIDEPDKRCIQHLCDAGRYGTEAANQPVYNPEYPETIEEQEYW